MVFPLLLMWFADLSGAFVQVSPHILNTERLRESVFQAKILLFLLKNATAARIGLI